MLSVWIFIKMYTYICLWSGSFIYMFVYIAYIYTAWVATKFAATLTLLVKRHILARHPNYYNIALNNTVDLVTMKIKKQS